MKLNRIGKVVDLISGWLALFLAGASSLLKTRTAIQLENVALQHQISVLQRCAKKRPQLHAVDRLLWVWLSRVWADSYVMVQGAVRTREYEREGVKQRVTEVRADSVGKTRPRGTADLMIRPTVKQMSHDSYLPGLGSAGPVPLIPTQERAATPSKGTCQNALLAQRLRAADRNRIVMKLAFSAFYAFHEHANSITYVFSTPPKGPNPTLTATLSRVISTTCRCCNVTDRASSFCAAFPHSRISNINAMSLPHSHPHCPFLKSALQRACSVYRKSISGSATLLPESIHSGEPRQG